MSNMEQENLPAVPEEKKDLIHSAKDFVNNIFQPLKGKDLGQAVEEFTSEMTLVAEGLCEDQARLRRAVDGLIKENRADVSVLETRDKWFGVTFKEDKDMVVRSFRELYEKGLYPKQLFS